MNKFSLVALIAIVVIVSVIGIKLRDKEIVRQSIAHKIECGHWCVIRCLEQNGIDSSPEDVTKVLEQRRNGNSLEEIASALHSFGMNTTRVVQPFDQIKNHLPCILHLASPGHFVLAKNSIDNQLIFVDGSAVFDLIHSDDVRRRYSGHALVVESKPIEVVPRVVDIGYLDSFRKEITVSIPVENTGFSPIAISDVRGDCSCLSFDFQKEELLPGDRTTICVALGFSNEAREVPFYHDVYVRFSRDKKTLKTVIRGERLSNISLGQKHVDFGGICRGEVGTCSISFVTRKKGYEEIVFRSSNEMINATVPSFDGEKVQILLSCKSALAQTVGEQVGIVEVVDKEGTRLNQFTYSAHIVDLMRAFPSRLSVNAGTATCSVTIVAAKELERIQVSNNGQLLEEGNDYMVQRNRTRKWIFQFKNIDELSEMEELEFTADGSSTIVSIDRL